MIKLIEVDSFDEVDFSDLKLPMIVVYENPKDRPGKFVARIWDTGRPTNISIVRDKLEEIQIDIPVDMARIDPSPEDDKCIVEIWM